MADEDYNVKGFVVIQAQETINAGVAVNRQAEVRNTDTDMYIVGMSTRPTPTLGTLCQVRLAETGESPLVLTAGSVDGIIIQHDNMGHGGNGATQYGEVFRETMFAGKKFYFLEKGERLYLHSYMENTHATVNYDIGVTAIIWYMTKKPP